MSDYIIDEIQPDGGELAQVMQRVEARLYVRTTLMLVLEMAKMESSRDEGWNSLVPMIRRALVDLRQL